MNDRGPAGRGKRTEVFRDALASLVVFLVALPLCMGISIASGAPVAAGLVTGIIGGIVVGLLGGAPLQVSGPAAGLTVICAEVAGKHGLAALGIVVLLAGTIQLAAGLLRLGQWFRAVSPAVVHGMLAGIGVLILSSQLHVMVDDRPRQGGLANLLSIPEAIGKGLPIPTWEDRSLREARLPLLHQFGQLHERQSEIAAHSATLVPTEEENKAARVWREWLASSQRQVADEVSQVQENLSSANPQLLAGERGLELHQALQVAQDKLGQAVVALESPPSTTIAKAQEESLTALSGVLSELKNHDWAAKVGILSITIIMLWKNFAPGRLRFVPAPLVAVIGVTWLAWAASLPVLYVEIPDRLTDGLTFPRWQVFLEVPWRELLQAGLFMAVIASAETLLCASAVDRMHSGEPTKYDRELAAQGVGNMLCGLAGALPMTGVIVRSAANVHAGAKSRLSPMLHGLWLLLFVLIFAHVLRLIPTAALAGILVYTGFRLIDFHEMGRLWQRNRSEALIMIATLTLVVVEDLLTGVLIGLGLSAVKLLFRFARLDVQILSSTKAAKSGVTVRITGAATFLRLPVLASRLDEVPHEGEVRFDMRRLIYLDEACLELLQTWIQQREAAGQKIMADPRRLRVSRRVHIDEQPKTEDTSRWPVALPQRPSR